MPRPRERLRDPRGRDTEVPCRVGGREAEVGDEVYGQLGPHGSDPAPAAPKLAEQSRVDCLAY